MGVPETVMRLLDPVVATLDIELVDVEYNGATLRVVVDTDAGITTDVLAKVNRLVSPILDEHDPINGRYTLEVSSPGVERNLTRPRHFVRAIGEDVVLKMHPGIDPRRVKGTLTEVRPDEDGNQTLIVVVREVDGNDLSEVETHEVSLDEVDKARTVFEWGPAPKPGGPKSKNTNTKKKSSVQTSAPTQKNQKKTEETP